MPISVLFATFCYVIASFLESQRTLDVLALTLCVTACLLRARGFNQAFLLVIMYVALFAERLLSPRWQTWPLFMLLPFACWIAVVLFAGLSRQITSWFVLGRLDRVSAVLALITAFIPVIALRLWSHRHEVYIHKKALAIPHLSLSMLILAGLGFAIVNALTEELIYRGVVQNGFEEVFKKPVVALVLQAIVFGSAHYFGVPGGLSGVLLASCYGLSVGLLRKTSKGLLWPVLVHSIVDGGIFQILAEHR